jgi:MFS family permease
MEQESLGRAQEPEIKEKNILGLEPNIFFVGLTSLLMDTTTKMLYAVMPMFLLTLGATKTELSLIEGIAESTASLLKALSGLWSDKIGRNKPFMVLGYAFTALLSPLFATAVSPLQVLVIRFCERVGKGIRTAPRDSLIAASSAPDQRGKGFGFHKAMDNSGAIVGPLLAFAVLSVFPGNYRRVFLISAVPAMFGVLAIVLFVREAKKSKGMFSGKVKIGDFPGRYYVFLRIAFVFTLGNSTDALLLVKANAAS